MVLFVITLTQLTGEPNGKILVFTADLEEYTKLLVAYVGFIIVEKPWPIGDRLDT